MTYKLTVIHAFAAYKKGDEITDATIIAEILAGENASCVVKTAA